MTCTTHPDAEAINGCCICNQALCAHCIYYADGDPYCQACVSELEREHVIFQKQNRRRTMVAGIVGAIVSVVGALGWQRLMFYTEFSLAMFTPLAMFSLAFGVAMLMIRIADYRSKILFLIGTFFAIGIMLGSERIDYDFSIHQQAASGLSAEKLLEFTQQNTYISYLNRMDPFDYAFILMCVVMIWRRLWPVRSDELMILAPEGKT